MIKIRVVGDTVKLLWQRSDSLLGCWCICGEHDKESKVVSRGAGLDPDRATPFVPTAKEPHKPRSKGRKAKVISLGNNKEFGLDGQYI